MGIRGLLLAAILALAPGMALAQGQSPWIQAKPEVPPAKKPLVGPREDYNGERPAPGHALPPNVATISAPGAVPPPRVQQPDTTTTAEKSGGAAGLAGGAATLLEEGAGKLTRYTNTLEGAELASDISAKADKLGKGAAVVGLVSSVKTTGDKCLDPKATTAECVQAGLNMASNEKTVIDVFTKGPAGSSAQVLQVAADATGAYNNCYGKDEATWVECVASLSDTAVSAMSNVPGGGKVISATYSIAKSVLPAAVDKAGYDLVGKSWGEWLYDKFKTADENARIEAESSSPAKLEEIRARRRAAYAAAAREMISKQEAHDAEQMRLENERRAAVAAEQQAAYQSQQQAAMGQVFANSIANSLQTLQQAYAPATGGNCPACTVSHLPTPSAPPPSSSGGCNLTAEDRAKGRVCTAN